MATRTKSPTSTTIAATLTAAVLASALQAAELRGAGTESGEPRDLVNRPDCWADSPGGRERCIFR